MTIKRMFKQIWYIPQHNHEETPDQTLARLNAQAAAAEERRRMGNAWTPRERELMRMVDENRIKAGQYEARAGVVKHD